MSKMMTLLSLGTLKSISSKGVRLPHRRYTQTAYQIAQQKWQLGGVPRPKSILEDDNTPVDLSEDNDAVNGVHPDSEPLHLRSPSLKPTPMEFKAHREAIRKAFPEGWSPPRKLSREAMDVLRSLHNTDPGTFTTPVLASKFRISPEAVRRILKSRWEPSSEKRSALIVKERKQQEEIRKKFKAEQHSKKKLQSMNVEELRRLSNGDDFWREKYSNPRTPQGEEAATLGVGIADQFTLR
ncbi:hypothetical protein CPB83DRAFT_851236 [Crepidotus variabilis]|uniref:Required for respiratory growth protein 9, mitochondrial n=1 Tax=Crepidotus variabilis TaxID=179855 RepID=A0A9P6EJX6_9AGAR|nr:hypothetical protein CPB83DRAFT_851236 [Crepidotus variabilis]